MELCLPLPPKRRRTPGLHFAPLATMAASDQQLVKFLPVAAIATFHSVQLAR